MGVHIGKHYRPKRMEERKSDGTYQGYNLQFDRDGERVQQSLIDEPPPQKTPWLSVVGYLAIIVVSFWIIATKDF